MPNAASLPFLNIVHSLLNAHRPNTARDVPSRLSHYTSAEGLLGILGGELWATHFAYLNDSTEVRYASELAHSLLSEDAGLPTQGYDITKATGTRRLFGDCIHQWIREGTREGVPIYVASFSERSDQLSQWRAYGQNGAGYCVVFEPQAFLKPPDILERVEYDRRKNEAVVMDIFDRIAIALHGRLGVAGSDDAQDELVHAAIHAFDLALFPLASHMKHPAFAEEAEWRLVHSGPLRQFEDSERADLEPERYPLRVRGGSLIPYTAIRLPRGPKSPVREIVVGPALDWSTAQLSVRHALRRAGIPIAAVKIRRSDCAAPPG